MNSEINSNPPNWNLAAAELQNSLWYTQVTGRGPREVNALLNNALPAIPQNIISIANQMNPAGNTNANQQVAPNNNQGFGNNILKLGISANATH